MTHVNLTVQTPDWETKTPEERRAWSLALDQAVTNLGQITAWAVEGVPGDEEPPQYDWVGWEVEPEMTGDGSGDPDKNFITIRDPGGEEYALIVHRTVGGKYPLDGDLANEGVARAEHIVAALNGQPERTARYHLEMGVDAEGGERLLAAPVGTFSTKGEAMAFAWDARGLCASEVREKALRANLDAGTPDVSPQELSLPIVGATLLTYIPGRDEPMEADLY